MAAVSARPFFVKAALDADRRFGDDRALDDALGLELLQSLAEHAIGDLEEWPRAASRIGSAP